MAISTARLRMGLAMGAALLVMVIAGFLGYARYRTHRFMAGLPAKLGVDIRRETDGYTFSKSVGPNTTMTLHASKAFEHKDGKLTLHDVSMVLYGRKQDRADRISGAEFEYDQQTGVVRATGEVHIDLQAPAHGQAGMPPPEARDDDKGVVHVKTSGLVFLQKLGVAATDQELEFRFAAMTGRAHGAEYNSDTGMVILQSEVEAHGEEHGAPVTLRASHAEFDRPSMLARATDPRYSSPTQTARGDRALVHLGPDSTPRRVEAEGNVVLAAAAGGSVAAPRADLLLDGRGRPETARLSGGVAYTEASALREVKSQAADTVVAFDAQGKARTVLMTGNVHLNERARASENAAWSERDGVASRMNFALDNGALRAMEANQAARVTLRDASGLTALSGDELRGTFTGDGKTARLNDLHATGHTVLDRALADGAEQTSAGDTLDVLMRQDAVKSDLAQSIRTATQAGHVVLASTAARKPGTAANITHARANLAVYDGAADHVTLTGAAEVADETASVRAAGIVLERASGDAAAQGSVEATYLQNPAAEPVHIVAERAELQHQAQRAIFHGSGRPARMWQGGSQVEAPVLELAQRERTLAAHGDSGGSAATPVHAVLAAAQSGTQPGTQSGAQPAPDGSATQPAVVRVASRTMIYRDQARQVEFAGGVVVEDADGTARAAEATAYLQPTGTKTTGTKAVETTPTGATPAPGFSLGGGVERIVAQGLVELDQPGRRATGERLVYTAADGLFVLTGTPAVRPRLMDETQGTVTGQTLSFHSGDRVVAVTGTVGERVKTVTRVKKH